MPPPDTPDGPLPAVEEQLREAEHSGDVRHLESALELLAGIPITGRADARSRRLRAETLRAWLALLAALDALSAPASGADPAPGDAPSLTVEPPPTREGVVYPPGTQPELIDDPDARREYEAAIAANARELDRYRRRAQLLALADEARLRAAVFVTASYQPTGPDDDRAAARRQIDVAALHPASRSALLEALPSS